MEPLTMWVMFACVRLSMWSSIYTAEELTSDTELCQVTKEYLMLSSCAKEREMDWQAYCGTLWAEGMQIDCQHANNATKRGILNTLSESKGSNQYACRKRV